MVGRIFPLNFAALLQHLLDLFDWAEAFDLLPSLNDDCAQCHGWVTRYEVFVRETRLQHD